MEYITQIPIKYKGPDTSTNINTKIRSILTNNLLDNKFNSKDNKESINFKSMNTSPLLKVFYYLILRKNWKINLIKVLIKETTA